MIQAGILALGGWFSGLAIRHATPFLLRKKDKSRPFSWPWVEFVTMVSFLSVLWKAPLSSVSIIWLVLALFLIALSSVDLLAKLIPVKVVVTGTILGLAFSVLFPGELLHFQNQGFFLTFIFKNGLPPSWCLGLILSFSGCLVGFSTLEFLRRVIGSMTQMEVMGMGDSLILMLIGSFLGPKMVLLAILPASMIGVIIGLYFKWIHGSPHSPFGPALALGGWLQLLFWEQIDTAIQRFYFLFYSLPPWVMSLVAFLLLVVLFLLILRIKKRAAEYERMIQDDYESIAKDIED